MVLGAMAGIAVFAFLNIKLLVFNLRKFAAFRRSEAYEAFAELQRRQPGSGHAAGARHVGQCGLHPRPDLRPGPLEHRRVHVPRRHARLPRHRYIAFRELGHFIGARLHSGGFNCAANNSFAQMLPAFALSMIGVGLAAPAAMST
jgi:hypothetical protein